MASLALAVRQQTPTPTPGVGPGELVDIWPLVVSLGWFLVGFAVVVLFGWYVVEPTVSRTVRRRNRNNRTIQDAVSLYFRLFVVVVGFFVGASVAGYSRFLTNSALVIAAATLAIGVAGQRVIGSLVSGVALVLDSEFNVGDYIEWDDGEGTVQSITLRITRVETPDGELVTIPNTVLTSQALTSPFRHGTYRIVDHVGIAYEDDVDEAIHHLEAVAAELDDVLTDPPPSAYVDEFGGDAVVLRVHYWIDEPSQASIFAIRSTYARAVKTRLDVAGITISPPSKRDLQGRIDVDRST